MKGKWLVSITFVVAILFFFFTPIDIIKTFKKKIFIETITSFVIHSVGIYKVFTSLIIIDAMDPKFALLMPQFTPLIVSSRH